MGKWILPEEFRNAPGMNHEIFLKGEKKRGSQYGKPTKDTNRKLCDSIIDNQYVYTVIYQHLKTCDVCNADVVMKSYLSKRNAMNAGKTSSGLVGLALKIARLKLPENRSIKKETVSEFIIRSSDAKLVTRYWKTFSVKQKVFAIKQISKFEKLPTKMSIFRDHAEWVEKLTDEHEIQKAIDILEVMQDI
jgi:hypothetical protein